MVSVLKSSLMLEGSGSSLEDVTEGARRATVETSSSAPPPDPEVAPIARRRRFSGASGLHRLDPQVAPYRRVLRACRINLPRSGSAARESTASDSRCRRCPPPSASTGLAARHALHTDPIALAIMRNEFYCLARSGAEDDQRHVLRIAVEHGARLNRPGPTRLSRDDRPQARSTPVPAVVV